MVIDGAINWGESQPAPSAVGFDLQARKSSIYEWVRQVRGGVLAGAFTVERHLSATIIHFMLGERIKILAVQDSFEEGLMGPLTFERRINVALLIAPSLLPAEEVSALRNDLGELRALRNSMAHKPFWFQPELNDDGHVANLVPIIMRGKSPLPLTTPLIEQVNQQIRDLITKTSGLAEMAEKQSFWRPKP